MRFRLLLITGCFGVLLLVGTALAQPGGGNRPGRPTPAGGSGAGRPTADASIPMPTGTRMPSQPFPAGTRQAPARGTPNVSATMPTRDGSSIAGQMASPTFVPQGTLESAVKTFQDTYDIYISDLFPASSDEDEDVIAAFAGRYLGITPLMLYGAQVDTSSYDYAQISQLLASFPAEMSEAAMTLLQSMEGTVYGGLYQKPDGLALLYSGTCTGSACATSSGQMQYMLENGALGIYGTYSTAPVTDANSALSLIQQSFPTLKGISFSAPTTEVEGYSFIGQQVSRVNGALTTIVYYVGTYSVSDVTLVYAMVGVGEGYAEVIKP